MNKFEVSEDWPKLRVLPIPAERILEFQRYSRVRIIEETYHWDLHVSGDIDFQIEAVFLTDEGILLKVDDFSEEDRTAFLLEGNDLNEFNLDMGSCMRGYLLKSPDALVGVTGSVRTSKLFRICDDSPLQLPTYDEWDFSSRNSSESFDDTTVE